MCSIEQLLSTASHTAKYTNFVCPCGLLQVFMFFLFFSQARLLLFCCARTVLQNGLKLLGIQPVQQMWTAIYRMWSSNEKTVKRLQEREKEGGVVERKREREKERERERERKREREKAREWEGRKKQMVTDKMMNMVLYGWSESKCMLQFNKENLIIDRYR